MSLPAIYCIPGLGADERIFTRLQLRNYRLLPVNWLKPGKKETLRDYAARMAELITDPEPLLLGVSFGGIVSIEIARLRPVRKLVLISSVKSRQELPLWMRAAGRLRLHQVFPMRHNRLTEKIANRRLGVTTEEERLFANAYRDMADQGYVSWSVDKILGWQNDWIPPRVMHIHGDEDRIFPVKNIRDHKIIPGGTHLMIMSKAEEISKLLDAETFLH